MIGYAYLDLDRNIVYKIQSFIEDEMPNFFSVNQHLIVKHWKFDTDDISSMWRLFSALNDLHVPKQNVLTFVQCIGFDMSRLKDANKIQ